MKDYNIRDALYNEIKRVIYQEKMRNPQFKDNNYRILIGYRIADYLMNDVIILDDTINSCQTFMGIPCFF